MKYLLSVLVVALIGICLGLSLMFLSGKPKTDKCGKVVSRQVVYVDVDKLVCLHPSWNAVQMMKMASTNMQPCNVSDVHRRQNINLKLSRMPLKAENDSSVRISRRSLEAEVCKSAALALQQLESEQWSALQTRLKANKNNMMQSAESEIRVQRRDIESDTLEKIKCMAELHSSDLLNAKIKVAALQSASKSPGVGSSLDSKLAEAQAQLDKIESDISSGQQQILAQTQDKIQSVRLSYESTIDSSLSTYENTENKRIRSGNDKSRKAVLNEICVFDALGSPEETSSVLKKIQMLPSVSRAMIKNTNSDNSRANLSRLGRHSSELKKLIRKDVIKAVCMLAGKKGMHVVFSKNGNRAPDKTQEFKKLMQEQAWSVCRPVLSEAVGS